MNRKAIFKYMGWKYGKTKTLPCPNCGYSTTKEHFPLDANDMILAMNKMVEKGDWQYFFWDSILSGQEIENTTHWLMQPDRFFELMSDYLLIAILSPNHEDTTSSQE